MNQPIRIAVIDDHPLFREGVAQILKAHEALDLVAVGGSLDDAVRIAKDTVPDVMLLDIQLPGGGLEAARLIMGLQAGIKIVILTASEDEEHVSAALEAGASGYVLKGISGNELVRTVQAVQNGDTYVTPDLAARMLKSINRRSVDKKVEKDLFALTPREEDILDCVSIGQTNKEIAIRLKIGEKTVKHYMTNIMHKLQVRNRVEAALKAKHRVAGAMTERR
jgi:two-component system, NarL family, nitrate/nitrite response regulator NarL